MYMYVCLRLYIYICIIHLLKAVFFINNIFFY